MSYVFSWVIGYAKSIAGIEIEIGATEAASEALEATCRLQCLNVGKRFRSYVFSLVIGYAKSILVIRIQFKQQRPIQRLGRLKISISE